jgi:DNA gyrase/topoisomerase IV subunit A
VRVRRCRCRSDSSEIFFKKLADLIDDRQIRGVSDITNLSADEETLLMIQLRRSANPQSVLDELYEHLPTDE